LRQTKQNQADAYRVTQRRAESAKKRHRLVDVDGRSIDLVNPQKEHRIQGQSFKSLDSDSLSLSLSFPNATDHADRHDPLMD
jgi:hypothetical protein